ncbi:N-acetyltransferase family protein [Ideonella sp.]|uniref:GNAT family N-acetyltransferase n=1 Tax=Ideonella sp. TaxID=1929293 RepID=UPI0035B0A3A9
MPHHTTHTTAATLVAATERSPADWHAAFTAAFADYLIGPFNLTLAQWPAFLARQGVDLALSRAAVVDGALVAFALVAPRPVRGRWRLGTMGALPAARGSGAAPALLDDFIARARQAGVRTLELEVFAANERALRLYQGRGFETIHPLRGHERAPGPAAGEAPPVQAVTLDEAWAWLDAADARIADLPLQVTSQVLRVAAAAAPAGAPLQAWRDGDAQLVFAEQPAQQAVAVHSLVDLDPAQPGALALAQALAARHPGHTLRVPALQRPDLGGDALQRAGFAPQALHQWLMRRAL